MSVRLLLETIAVAGAFACFASMANAMRKIRWMDEAAKQRHQALPTPQTKAVKPMRRAS